MTLPLVDWLQNGAIALLLALVVVQGRHLNRQGERTAGLETWAGVRDPDYWRERLGTVGGPFVNDEPEPDGPPECPGVHPVGVDGRTCEACGLVLVP